MTYPIRPIGGADRGINPIQRVERQNRESDEREREQRRRQPKQSGALGPEERHLPSGPPPARPAAGDEDGDGPHLDIFA